MLTLLQCNHSFTSANFPSPPPPLSLLLSDSVFEQIALVRADKAELNVRMGETNSARLFGSLGMVLKQ